MPLQSPPSQSAPGTDPTRPDTSGLGSRHEPVSQALVPVLALRSWRRRAMWGGCPFSFPLLRSGAQESKVLACLYGRARGRTCLGQPTPGTGQQPSHSRCPCAVRPCHSSSGLLERSFVKQDSRLPSGGINPNRCHSVDRRAAALL